MLLRLLHLHAKSVIYTLIRLLHNPYNIGLLACRYTGGHSLQSELAIFHIMMREIHKKIIYFLSG